MAIDLSPFVSVKTALFCKIVVPNYETLTFSDYHKAITFDGSSYTALGSLLGVSDSLSELKVSGSDLTITISGIPTKNMTDFLTKKIKGSQVTVKRGFFELNNDSLLDIPDNPVGKFYGIINNYSINETWEGLDSTTTITINCKSKIGFLSYKKAGRRTNPLDMKYWYPGDSSMDKVPGLSGAKLQFGMK